jgi:hypothetical protein
MFVQQALLTFSHKEYYIRILVDTVGRNLVFTEVLRVYPLKDIYNGVKRRLDSYIGP